MPEPARDCDTPGAAAHQVRRWLVATTTLFVASGCSFVAVSGPPADHARRAYFDCTTSRLAPVLDLGLGALAALATVGAVAGEHDGQSSRVVAIALPIGLTALAITSAFDGFKTTSACDDAKAALALRMQRQAARETPVVMEDCHADVQCKSERICVAGRCVDPPAVQPAPAAAPVSAPAPAPAESAPAAAPAPATEP